MDSETFATFNKFVLLSNMQKYIDDNLLNYTDSDRHTHLSVYNPIILLHNPRRCDADIHNWHSQMNEDADITDVYDFIEEFSDTWENANVDARRMIDTRASRESITKTIIEKLTFLDKDRRKEFTKSVIEKFYERATHFQRIATSDDPSEVLARDEVRLPGDIVERCWENLDSIVSDYGQHPDPRLNPQVMEFDDDFPEPCEDNLLPLHDHLIDKLVHIETATIFSRKLSYYIGVLQDQYEREFNT